VALYLILNKNKAMKNLLIVFTLLPFAIHGQQKCVGSLNGHEFNANKIQTYLLPQGHKFQALNHYGLFVPYPSPSNNPYLKTISSSAPWIGGYSDGKLYMAAQQYITSIEQDYYNGPLDLNGMKYLNDCHLFDRAWNVFREDVLHHIYDFQTDGKIDDTIAAIFGWPAEGNSSFSRFNGFELDENHNGGWAPFADHNLNNRYEPQLGEYPVAYLKGKPTIPGQLMWMVFNEQGQHTVTNGRPFGIEIQLTAFGYHCEDNEILNHSLFNSYKIINQSGFRLDSIFFGQFHAYEIGATDEGDYVGCDTLRNTEFGYNEDDEDGEMHGGSYYGYGLHPPVQSFTYLSHPMYSFIKQTMIQTPQTDLEFYRMLTGRWRPGYPITIGGNGYSTDPGLPTTRYIYHGDPRIPGSWSELTVGDVVSRTRTISSVNLHTLLPGEQVTVEGVYSFHRDSSRSFLEQFDVMDANLDLMADVIPDIDQYCTPHEVCINNDCVWPGDFNHDHVVDHRDLLYWGVTNGTEGPSRNGLVNWRGHYAEDWSKEFYNGTNAKHQDADGNGKIDKYDLQHNLSNFSKTTPGYETHDVFPQGNELVIVSEPMDANGDIGFVRVMSKRPLHDIYGISFELAFDTFFYTYSQLYQNYPLDTLGVCFVADDHGPYYGFDFSERPGDSRYSFVATNHENFSIPDSFTFMQIPFGLKQKYQIPPKYLPYQIVIRLKNLIGINKEGRELILGADKYIIENPFSTAAGDLLHQAIKVFPNPCQEEVMILAEGLSDVEIMDVHGKLIKVIPDHDFQTPLALTELVPGMYFLRIRETESMVKIIKQ
jgi:hypothetical protein